MDKLWGVLELFCQLVELFHWDMKSSDGCICFSVENDEGEFLRVFIGEIEEEPVLEAGHFVQIGISEELLLGEFDESVVESPSPDEDFFDEVPDGGCESYDRRLDAFLFGDIVCHVVYLFFQFMLVGIRRRVHVEDDEGVDAVPIDQGAFDQETFLAIGAIACVELFGEERLPGFFVVFVNGGYDVGGEFTPAFRASDLFNTHGFYGLAWKRWIAVIVLFVPVVLACFPVMPKALGNIAP